MFITKIKLKLEAKNPAEELECQEWQFSFWRKTLFVSLKTEQSKGLSVPAIEINDKKQWRIQDFPRGLQPQRWRHEPITFINFSQKLHENEKNGRGMCPCSNSPMKSSYDF